MEQTQYTAKNVPIETLILYASQTGNCDSISEQLLEDIKSEPQNDKYFKNVKRFPLNKISSDPKKGFCLESKNCLKLVIFFASSTGNGDMPDNGETFFRDLRRKTNLLAEGQKTDIYSHIFYTILGLGSTDYSKYQYIPRFIDQKMELLGAQKFYHRGEADDATSLEIVVEPWLEGIQKAMRDQWDQIRSRDEIQTLMKPSEVLQVESKDTDSKKSTNITFYGHLKEINVLNPGSKYKEVYHISIEFTRKIDEDKIQVGQSVAIFPGNQESEINHIIQAFGWKENELLGNKTVKEMLMQDVDVRSQKVNFEVSQTLKDKYGFVTLLDLANEGVSVQQHQLEDLPRIKPRFYSIVNDPFPEGETKTSKLEFLLSRTQFQKNGLEKFGLCSEFLTVKNKQEIKCQFSNSYRVLKMPPPGKIIMVAHGTGIAPFISILKKIMKSVDFGKYQIQLLYGVRNDKEEFLFGSFLREFFAKSPQNQLFLACSRDIFEQRDNVFKGHVQDIIPKLNFSNDFKMLLCGNKSALGKDIFEAMISNQIMNKEKIEKMKENGEILMELWGE